MAVFTEQFLSDIRDRIDIVSLIGEHVTLKRSGTSFKGVCPFHNEKSPSFYVHPVRRHFHCFGCHESGDIFTFIMKLESRSFPDTVRMLAEKAGLQIDEKENVQQLKQKSIKEKCWAIHDVAAGFYVKKLLELPNGPAQKEIEKRGILASTSEKYRLGYAPEAWDQLTNVLLESFSTEDCVQAGLIQKGRVQNGKQNYFDRFRHRLMFTIADAQGRICGFSGRVLEEEKYKEKQAKYINSAESPVYKKSEMLFGLNEAKTDLRKQGYAILCEGNFDVLSIHQSGFENVVAPLGTALTEDQCLLMRRFVQEVVCVFDGDAAGKKALWHSSPLFFKTGLSAKAVILPQGEDPDSYLRKHGKVRFHQLIDSASNLFELLIEDAALQAGQDTVLKAKHASQLMQMTKDVQNEIERELYKEKIKSSFQVQSSSARSQAVAKENEKRSEEQQKRFYSKTSGISFEHQKLLEKPMVVKPKNFELGKPYELEIFGALLEHPDLLEHEISKKLPSFFSTTELRDVMTHYLNVMDPNLLLEQAEKDMKSWISGRLAKSSLSKAQAEQSLKKGFQILYQAWVKNEQQRLGKSILDARKKGEHEKAEELTMMRDKLLKTIM